MLCFHQAVWISLVWYEQSFLCFWYQKWCMVEENHPIPSEHAHPHLKDGVKTMHTMRWSAGATRVCALMQDLLYMQLQSVSRLVNAASHDQEKVSLVVSQLLEK